MAGEVRVLDAVDREVQLLHAVVERALAVPGRQRLQVLAEQLLVGGALDLDRARAGRVGEDRERRL